ncbi:MAG: class I SAM-dependent methyltransferase [Euryarchaeota archaeon]|nr:class I SAM-dependent methyltransferase [Euryarchaeota archaeon]
MIKRGYSRDKILKKVNEEIYEIAKCRIKMKNKFSVHHLYFDNYGLRYSTPEIIGRFRAEKIKNFRIADLSCGVGLQAIFFSFTNKEVLGIDISKKRVEYAKRNAAAYNAKNIKFIHGNCFSEKIYRIAKEYDILFSDPARAESEEERKLETLIPSPLKIIRKYGKDKNYIFDLPPQISIDKIPISWGKEYISINGRITRFTAYVGDIKTHNRIAVTLPKKGVFWSDELRYKDTIITDKSMLSDYIYLVDESLYYARLLNPFQKKYEITYLHIGKRRTLATGNWIDSPFLSPYRVLCIANSMEELIKCFRKESIGKVTLRFDLPPEGYWTIRKRIESTLKGNKKGSVFRVDDKWIATENVT